MTLDQHSLYVFRLDMSRNLLHRTTRKLCRLDKLCTSYCRCLLRKIRASTTCIYCCQQCPSKILPHNSNKIHCPSRNRFPLDKESKHHPPIRCMYLQYTTYKMKSPPLRIYLHHIQDMS